MQLHMAAGASCHGDRGQVQSTNMKMYFPTAVFLLMVEAILAWT
jgi:hypothetical protein